MNRVLAGMAAGLAVSALMLPSPAMADFFIKKNKPKATAPQTTQQRPTRAPRRTRPSEVRQDDAAPPVPLGGGIDPLLMQQAVVEARYSAQLDRDPATKTAVLQVTNGKSGWSVNFKNCADGAKCGAMEFYTLWRVSNEANVCKVWSSDVARDPSHTLGQPFCYVVPDLARQFHLKLSTEQSPYADLGRLPPEEAKQRMGAMIVTWSSALNELPKAWEIASAKCPRATDNCGTGPAPQAKASRSY